MLVTKQKHFLIAQKYFFFFFFLPTPISGTLSCPEGDLMKGAHNKEQKHFPFLFALRRCSRKQGSTQLCQLIRNSFQGYRKLGYLGVHRIFGRCLTHPLSSSLGYITSEFPLLSLSPYSTIHTALLLHRHNLEIHSCC